MPLTIDYHPTAAYHAELSAGREEKLLVRGSQFDASVVELDELTIGQIRYPLRRRLNGQYFPLTGELIVEEFGGSFVGHGTDLDDALEDFRLTVHQRFQQLMYRRPFELTGQDEMDWALLCRMIDETSFRNALPVQMRQFGEVQFCQRSRPYAIRWDSGHQEVIDPAIVRSPEYLTYRPGQPVEAVVERDRLTDAIVAIPFITRVRSFRSSRTIENELNDKIGSSLDYPETDWD